MEKKMKNNPNNIKLVAVDVDGTFVRTDYTYDKPRFLAIMERMKKAGCEFVVASGNQYYQLRSLFPEFKDTISYIAENGALVKAKDTILFTTDIPKDVIHKTLEICNQYPEIKNTMCGLESAYCERGKVSEKFFKLTNHYYHKLQWVDDFADVNDTILKFAPMVPVEKTDKYMKIFEEQLDGGLVPTSSGHGSIDLIVPNCHKASGIERLAKLWNITPEQCVSFGDGGNDIEMLMYCGRSYAMDNAPDHVKACAKNVCPSNNEDGVLVILDQLFPVE
ncbi:hypothetical protein EDD63_1493 [Breznakia blatticola]|uniref:Sugar-phosphatase n=2 Tax=Breznakia blatticola TaxID=1754012 RepID=A0A4R7ZFT0_9FIRM|nr:hypothetical protein EDD63_1493 [Breznakia blatticola]